MAPGSEKVLSISLSFQVLPFFHKSVNQFSNSFAFDAPTVWNALSEAICTSPSLALSEGNLKPTCTPKHIHLSLNHPLVFSMVLDPSSVSGY